jgi:hypothetical protein
MQSFPELSDVLNDLVDLSSAGHAEDVAYILSALIDDIRARAALDELEWILTSMRDTNLSSTSCMVLATLLLTTDHPSIRRKSLCLWYLGWYEANRSEFGSDLLKDLLLPEGASDEHCPTSSACGSVPPVEDN